MSSEQGSRLRDVSVRDGMRCRNMVVRGVLQNEMRQLA